MATSTKTRAAAAASTEDVRVAKIAWFSAGMGAVVYAVAIDARGVTWPLAHAVVSGLSAAVAGAL